MRFDTRRPELMPGANARLFVCLMLAFVYQQQSTAPQSGHAVLTHIRSMCS